ncbi:transposase family protein [Streptomyces sp. B1I3]|uniref:helix-turn-helix domain-containing protein n=1 Tax=Streptomyces sp. B1I3 TaxID=3042264 RepID=UPI00358E6813
MRPAPILPCPASLARTSASCSKNSRPGGRRRGSRLHERRGGARRRAAGAGPKQRLAFTDRLLITLVHLRLGLPHVALAELYGLDRSTLSGAIRQVRPLLATRGFAVPDHGSVRPTHQRVGPQRLRRFARLIVRTG